jgi:hypothetical protein
VSVDGRWAASRRLEDADRWETVLVSLPRRTSRRFRLVEVRTKEVLFAGNLGIQLGEVVYR